MQLIKQQAMLGIHMLLGKNVLSFVHCSKKFLFSNIRGIVLSLHEMKAL